jgi:ADP-ribosylglycohydrolase
VSAGVSGASRPEAIEVALDAAGRGARLGFWVAGADVAARIRLALELADPADPTASLRRIYETVGTSLATQESVPAAFGILALFPEDPWRACLAAASLGGDSDTVAAMVGAMGGALTGIDAFPADARAVVASVNSLDLDSIADDLMALR